MWFLQRSAQKTPFILFLIGVLFLSSASASRAAITDDVVGFWGLNESSGTRTDNIGGNTLSEADGAVSSVTGKVSSGAQFQYLVSGYLSIANNSSFNLSGGDFTLSLWVYLDNKSGTQVFAAKYGSTGYAIYYEPLSTAFLFSTYSGGGITTGSALGDPTTGTWYHIVGVHDSVANTNTIRINDQYQNIVSGVTDIPDDTGPFTIGGFGASGAYVPNGRVDAVGLWKRKLTSGEITSLYNAGNGLELTLSTPTPTATPVATQTSDSRPPVLPAGCADSAPAGIADLFQIDTTDTTATLYFRPVNNATKYVIAYGFAPHTGYFGTEFDSTGSTGVLTYTIRDLTPNTKYAFMVRGGHGCMPGNWSRTLQSTTKKKKALFVTSFLSSPKVLGAQSICQYTVLEGDTLWKIASQKLGSGFLYDKIMKENQLQTSLIRVGETLHFGCVN